MSSSLDLYKLIQSLNRAEKRHLSIFIKNHAFKECDAYLSIYEVILKQDVYNEKKVIELLFQKGFKKTSKYFAVHKKRLYDLIIRALRNYSAEVSVENILYSSLIDLKNLYDKKLYKQCEKLLIKTKKIAEHYQYYKVLLNIVEFEKRLLFRLNYSTYPIENVTKIDKQEKELLDKLDEVHHQWLLMRKMDYLQHRDGYARNKQNIKERKKLIEQEFERNVDFSENYRAEFRFHISVMEYYFAIYDLETCLKWIEKGMDLMERHMHIQQEEPIQYLYKLYDFIIVAAYLGEMEHQIENALIKIDKFVAELPKEVYEKNKDKIKRMSLLFKLKKHIDEGDFYNAVKVANFTKDFIETNNVKLLAVEWGSLKKNMIISLIGISEYEKAIDEIDDVMRNKDILQRHVFSLILILELIAHFELGNYRLLEHKIKSAHRFLYKSNHLYKLENLLLKHIKQIIKKPDAESDFIEFFKDLKVDLIKLREDAYEFKYLQRFDIISWLDSKIDQKSFQDIVRERYLNTSKPTTSPFIEYQKSNV